MAKRLTNQENNAATSSQIIGLENTGYASVSDVIVENQSREAMEKSESITECVGDVDLGGSDLNMIERSMNTFKVDAIYSVNRNGTAVDILQQLEGIEKRLSSIEAMIREGKFNKCKNCRNQASMRRNGRDESSQHTSNIESQL